MKQYLEQRMYESAQIPKENLRIYQVEDLEGLSASALYTDKLPKFSAGGAGFELPRFDPLPTIGTFSDFKPASNFDLGPGIARRMSEAGNMIERIRTPGYGDKDDANHINYEYKIPGIKKPIFNIHMPLFNEDE